MTAPRAQIEASLAARGQKVLWANEQESAVLAGYGADGVDFRAALPKLETRGFPPINPSNNKRFIPAIEAFYWAELDSTREERAELLPSNIRSFEEIQNDSRKGKRRAS